MDARSPAAATYTFGPFRLDGERMTLSREGVGITTTPRVVAALLYLVEHAGELVSREEMLRALWPGRVAEEANLSQAISAVRKALAANGDATEWILTVPGRGYRFIGHVEQEQGCTPPTAETSPAPQPAARSGLAQRPALKLRTKVAGLIGAAVLVAGVPAAWMLAHQSRGSGAITEVVLAAPLNETNERVFDYVIPRVLQVDLGQSPLLKLATDAQVSKTLELMKRPIETPLSAAVAREVCLRNNGGVLVTPSIVRLTSIYLLALAATDCASGRTLYQTKASASDKDGVARSLDVLSNRLRVKLGETTTSVTRLDVPLMAEKTASFDALAAYSEGVWLHNHNREVEAIAAFQHAVELDPSFAMAYDGLYSPLYITKQTDRARAAAANAFALRNTASDRDRLLIASHYHFFVERDLYAALADLKLLTALYPLDGVSWANLSNVENWLGDYPAAITAGRRALSLEPNMVASYSVLARALNHDGQIVPSLQVDEMALRRGVAGGDTRGQLIAATFELNRRRADELIKAARGTPLERDALLQAFDVYAESGQMRRADEAVARAVELGRGSGVDEDHVSHAAAYVDVGLLEDARAELAKVSPADQDGPYYVLEARLGERAKARADLDHATAEAPHDTLLNEYYGPQARAILSWRGGRAHAAVQALTIPVPLIVHDIDALYLKGLIQLDAADPAGAAQSFRAVLNRRGFGYSSPYDLAKLGLARALRQLGDQSGTRRAYESFFVGWRDADPHLPVLRAAQLEYGTLRSPHTSR